jgi:hypothetical protein
MVNFTFQVYQETAGLCRVEELCILSYLIHEFRVGCVVLMERDNHSGGS